MKFGKWSLTVLSLFLIGFFVVNFVFPVVAQALTSVTLVTPASNSYIKGTYVLNGSVNFGALNVTNVTFWYINSTGTFNACNNTNTTADQINFNCSWSTASTPDGVYNFTANATNSTGDTASAVNTNITIDNTAPTISLTYPSNNAYLKGSWINITGTASDTNNATVVTNDTNFTTMTGSYASWNFTNTSAATDGIYHVQITANDSAGNSNSVIANFTVDNTNPVINNVTPANGTYINSTSSVVFQSALTETNKDNTLNTTVYYRRYGLTTWTPSILTCYGSSPYTCNKTIDVSPYVGNTEVLQYFFNTTDLAGNTGTNGTTESPLRLTVDTTAPTSVTGLTHADDAPTGYDNDTSLDFSWSAASDTTSNIQKYRIYLSTNGGAFSYLADNSSATGYTLTGIDGNNYSIRVTSVDNAGNENSTGTTSATIIVDTTAPSVSGAAVNDTVLMNTAGIQINVTVTDTNRNETDVKVSGNSGAALVSMSRVGSTDVFSVDTTPTSLGCSANADCTLRFYVTDSAGILNSAITTTITTDNTSPSAITFVSPTEADGANKSQSWYYVNATFTETHPYQCFVDNGTSNTSMTLVGTTHCYTNMTSQTDGTKTYKIWLSDDAGNWNSSSTITVKLDTVAPTVTANPTTYASGKSKAKNGDTVTLNATVTDASPSTGINTVTVNAADLGCSGTLAMTKVTGTDFYTAACALTGAATTGTKSLAVTATDYANNSNSAQSITVEVDVTAPTIVLTYPSNNAYLKGSWINITGTASDTNNATVVTNDTNFTTMTGSYATWNFTNTSALTDGIYHVQITANDSAGNSNSVIANFTVDNTNPIINNVRPINATYINSVSSVLFQVGLTEQNIDSTVNATVYFRRQDIGDYNSTNLTCYGNAPFYTCNTTEDLSTKIGLNGEVLQYFFNTTDLAGNTASNGTQSNPLTVTLDIVKPTWSSNNTSPLSPTIYSPNQNYQFNITWTNGLSGVSTVLIEHNLTGSPTPHNETMTTGKSVTNGSEYYFNAGTLPAGTYGWKSYANDTAGNMNSTDQWTYTVAQATPSLTLTISPSNSVTYPTTTTATGSVTGGDPTGTYNISLYRNTTLVNSSTSGSSVSEAILLAAGVYNYTLAYNGTQNYTSAVLTNITTISPGILSLSIAGNNVAYPDSVSITATRGSNSVDTDVNYTLWRNSTLVSSANGTSGNHSDASQLAAGWYVYTYNATAGANWTVNSTGVTLNINVSRGVLLMSLTGAQAVTYSASTTVNGSKTSTGDADVNYTLWRNDTGIVQFSAALGDAPPADTLTLGAGGYTYTLNTTDATFENYTANTTGITTTVTVNKGPTSIVMYLNDSTVTSRTYNRTQPANFTAALNVSNKNVCVATNMSGWVDDCGTTPRVNLTALNTAGVFNVTGYFAGDTNYSASSNTTYVTVNDVVYPTWSSNNTSPVSGTAYSQLASYQFNITWVDDVGINKTILEWNGTTNYTYPTSISRDGTATNGVYYITLTDLPAGTYTYRWIANDTSNNVNNTNTLSYTIGKATSTTKLWINDLENNRTFEQGTALNFTATVNTSYGVTLYLASNTTGWGADKYNSSTTMITNTSSSSGYTGNWFNITAYFAGDTNYSASSQTYYLNVTSDVTGPTVLVYGYTNASVKKADASLALNISASDSGVGINASSCVVGIGSNSSVGSISYLSGWCNGTVTVPSGIGADGNKTINVTVNDSSNNVGYNSSYVLWLDNAAPVLSISTPSSGQYVKASGGIIWVNGTVYDLVAMGSGNITTNNTSNYTVYSFNGTNNTAFNIINASAVSDGSVALTVYYNDSVLNTGSASIEFYVDNTAPTATAVTTGTKAANASQSVQVTVTDAMTNATITLNYKRGSIDTSWQSTAVSGTPSTSTTYTATIDTSMLGSGEYVYYYVTGTDNATNSISAVSNNATNPLAYFKVGAEDTTAPVISSVTNGTVTANSAYITWTTDEAATSEVQYGLTTAYGSTSGVNSTSTTSHSVYIYGLSASTTYHYKVISKDSSSNENSSSDYNFTTSAADTTAPIITASGPEGTLASGTNVEIYATANEASTCLYGTTDKAYSGMTGVMSGNSSTNHTNTFSSLSNGDYTYFVRCNDTSGNVMTTSAVISFTVNVTDTTAPVISSVTNGTVTANSAYITWTTDEAATSEVQYGLTTAYGSTSGVNSTSTTSHSVYIYGLSASTTYHYKVISKDSSSNENSSSDYNFTTSAADTTAPVVINSGPSGTIYVNSTTIWVYTDESASCKYDTADKAYANLSSTLTATGNNHTASLTSLSDGSKIYYVRCNDTSGNIMISSAVISFIVNTSDVTAPQISSVSSSVSSSSTVTVTWTTDESSTSQVEYGLTTSYGYITGENATLTTSHSVTISGLSASTTYHYRVKSKDAASNPATSADYNFTTSAADTTAPIIINSGPSGKQTSSSVTIFVTTDENATCKYDTTDKTYSSMSNSLTASSNNRNHTKSITGLSDSAANYVYFVRCNDTSGNLQTIGTSVSFYVDTRSNFNITVPNILGEYLWATGSKWNSFALPLWLLQNSTTLTYYNVTSVLSSVNGNFDNFYVDIGNNDTWRSYVPGGSINSFTDFTYNGAASVYYIHMNTTDRIEIN